MTTVYYLCWDNAHPTGGDKKAYHHVELLRRNGIEACVLHHTKGFRYTQFAHEARLSSVPEAKLNPEDILVIPEDHGPETAGFVPGLRKVLFNQNAYYTFRNYPLDLNPIQVPYTHRDFVGTLVVSEDNYNYLSYAFPGIRIVRIHNAIDFDRFGCDAAPKKPKIAFQTRKHADEVGQVINLLKARGALHGYQLAPITSLTEEQVAAVLRDSQLYLSFGYPEGCPLSVAEAMASGCIVVGYHGMGGRELFDPDFSYPIENGEILEFARTVERVLSELRSRPAEMQAKGARANEFIRREFSAKREEEELLGFWRQLLAEPSKG